MDNLVNYLAMVDKVLALLEAEVQAAAVTDIGEALARVDADPAEARCRAKAELVRRGRVHAFWPNTRALGPEEFETVCEEAGWRVPDEIQLSLVQGEPRPVADWPDWRRQPTGSAR